MGFMSQEGAVLRLAHTAAFKKLGIDIGEDSRIEIAEGDVDQFNEIGLADGLRIGT